MGQAHNASSMFDESLFKVPPFLPIYWWMLAMFFNQCCKMLKGYILDLAWIDSKH